MKVYFLQIGVAYSILVYAPSASTGAGRGRVVYEEHHNSTEKEDFSNKGRSAPTKFATATPLNSSRGNHRSFLFAFSPIPYPLFIFWMRKWVDINIIGYMGRIDDLNYLNHPLWK